MALIEDFEHHLADLLPAERGPIIVAVPAGSESDLVGEMPRLDALSAEFERPVLIVTNGDVDRLWPTLQDRPNMRLATISGLLSDLRASLLAGEGSLLDSIAFVSDLSYVTSAFLDQAQGVFCGLGGGDITRGDLMGCTLVTSVFRSDEFLQGFINNSVALDGYGHLIDHIFLVAKMSELECQLLNDMMSAHPNVMVFWMREDPGLYPCWNLGIRMARRTYVSNANVDDLRDPAHVISLIDDLEGYPDVLVAATALNPFYDYPADGSLPEERAGWYSDKAGRFGIFDIAYLSKDEPPQLTPHNMPHCMPVWRRSLHDTYGWFDEARYGTYADWAFWLNVLRNSQFGWINPNPFGYYFVNPTSHNRRGTELERLHKVVEDDFIDVFKAKKSWELPHTALSIPQVPRKLRLSGREQAFGQHRNSFNRLIHALEPLERDDDKGVLFIPFLERYFVWGQDPGEARSDNPEPLSRDWIGILHVPFDAPEWFDPDISPEAFLDTDLWHGSRHTCRGVLTLSADLAADLKAWDPDLNVLAVRHPVELDVKRFNPAAYHARPRVVQAGDWLRKLQAIHRLKTPGHERVMLLKANTEKYLEREMEVFGDQRDPGVDMRKAVPNDEYDAILSSSVMLCLMYATAANNLLIECIARGTPILVNPLPSAVEYLGPDYPLYVSDEVEASRLLEAPELIDQAHRYLLARRLEIDLSYDGFCRDIARSEWYTAL